MNTALPTDEEIHSWILHACVANMGARAAKVKAAKIAAIVRWSPRMTSSMGVFRIGSSGIWIGLSPKLFARATRAKQRETVIHEACHAICPGGHNAKWKAAMTAAGVPPTVCHDIKLHDTVPRSMPGATCGCRSRVAVTHAMAKEMRSHAKVKSGVVVVCQRCRSVVELTGRMVDVEVPVE